MALTLLMTTDQTQTVAYGRNFSDTIFKAEFVSGDTNSPRTLDLTIPALIDMNKFFVSVTPGTIILFSNTAIPTADLTRDFLQLNGEMVAYDSLFTIDANAPTLYYMPIAVPATGAAIVSLSFFI